MKNGIYIPPFAVRLSVAAVTVAAAAVLVVQAPDIWRYIRIAKM